MEQIAALARLQLWYALLYVVVEGYQELEERDEAVDALLANRAMVTAMKGFHHASFQAQEVPFSGQMLRFIAHPDSDQWPGKLHAALRQYFETRTDARELVRHFTGEL